MSNALAKSISWLSKSATITWKFLSPVNKLASSLIFDRDYYVYGGVSVPLNSLGKTQTVRSLFYDTRAPIGEAI